MPHLGMQFLGGFQVSLDGTPLVAFEFEQGPRLAGLPGGRVASSASPGVLLATLLWPDWPNRAALSNLRYALSDLRKVIGDRTSTPPYLLITRETIRFNPASEQKVDVVEFTDLSEEQDPEFLIQAISLYQGEFLEGFSISDSGSFEDWVRLKREQFRSGRYLEALFRLATMLSTRGEYERALALRPQTCRCRAAG